MDQTPWLVPESVTWLATVIQPGWYGWEWGSGGSSIWLARRVRHLVTVEHDAEWVAETRRRLARFGLANVTVCHIPKGAAYYEDYADFVLQEADASLGLILIDGRNRPRCLRNALPKLAPGGVLVLDDSQRGAYQEAIAEVPADWERHDFEGWWNGRKVTTTWVRM